MVKDFARSLTKINDEKYRKCYMVKAKLQIFNRCNGKYDYKVYVEKSNYRFSKIISEAYSNNILIASLTINLVNFKYNNLKFTTRKEEKIDSLKKEHETILGYVANALCFKCNFTKYMER